MYTYSFTCLYAEEKNVLCSNPILTFIFIEIFMFWYSNVQYHIRIHKQDRPRFQISQTAVRTFFTQFEEHSPKAPSPLEEHSFSVLKLYFNHCI